MASRKTGSDQDREGRRRSVDGQDGRDLAVGGLLVAGIAAGMLLPKLFTGIRAVAPSIGGMTYRSGPPVGAARPKVDPARGVPA